MQVGSQVFRQGTAFHSAPTADQDQNSAGLQGEFESGLSDPLQGGPPHSDPSQSRCLRLTDS